MGKRVMAAVMAVWLVSLGLTGCLAQKKVSSSIEAIQTSKAIKPAQAQAEYLLGQARAFYDAKDLKGSMEIAEYVLRNVEENSRQAKGMIEKAKRELAEIARKKMDEARGKRGIK